MRSLTIALTVTLFISTLSGCSRIRQMTRRDYAGMEDPFAERQMQDGRLADNRDPRIADTTPGLTDRGDRLDMNADSRIRTASQTRQVDSANSKFAGASASGLSGSKSVNSGPSLSDFVSNSERKIADARSAAGAFGERAKAAATKKTDMVGMTQFLEEQATASGLTETSEELDKDFAEFVASQQQEWTHKKNAIKETASPFINAAASTAQAFSASAEAANPFGAAPAAKVSQPAFSVKPQQSDVATPFIQQASAERMQSAPSQASPAQFQPPAISPRPSASASGGATNPFESFLQGQDNAGRTTVESVPANRTPPPVPEWNANPSAGMGSGIVDPFVDLPAAPAKPQTIDSDFSFDSGWKPSDLVQQ